MLKSKNYFPKLTDALVMQGLSRILFIVMIAMPILVQSSMIAIEFPRLEGLYYGLFMRTASIGTLLFCLLTKKFSSKELKIYFLVFILFYLIAFFQWFRFELLYLMSSILLVKEEKPRTLAKIIFWTYLICFVFIMGLYFAGFLPGRIIESSDGTIRNSLGFGHPNTTGILYLTLLFNYLMALKNRKINLWLLVSYLVGLLILNTFIDSSTTLMLGIFICIYLFIYRCFPVLGKFMMKKNRIVVIVLPFFLLVFSYTFGYFYNEKNEFLRRMNSLFTGRLSLNHLFVNEYPLSLFGVELQFSNPENIQYLGYRFLDNGYLHTLLNLGVIYLLLILIFLIFLTLKINENGYSYVLIISIVLFIYGFSEQGFLSLPFNPILLFGGHILSENFREKKRK